MSSQDRRTFRFWHEVKRRNVPRVLAIYAGTAFIILEVADMIFPRWGFPDWTVDLVLYLLLLGALIAGILAWIYDVSPEGIVKTVPGHVKQDAEPGKGKERKPLVSNLVIAVLVLVIGILVYPKIFKGANSALRSQ